MEDFDATQLPLFTFIDEFVVTETEVWVYRYIVAWDGSCTLFDVYIISGG